MAIIKKILVLLFALLIIIYIIARIYAPAMIDKKFNTVIHAAPYQISEETQKLYHSLEFVADLHSDLLLWKRDILAHNQFGHQDLPRMIKANMALQAFTIVNKVPQGLNFKQNSDKTDQLTLPFFLQGRSIKSLFDLTERVLEQSRYLHQASQNSQGQLFIIKSKLDLTNYLEKRKKNNNISAGFLGIEGAQALQGDLDNIDVVFNAGIRMIGLTHFFDNEVGGSAHGVNKGGITEFGKQAVKKMQQKNILIDLAHASPQLIDDVLAMASKPIIVSHTGVKGTCDNVRNLSDKHLQQIAQTGGIVGIAMFEFAVCGNQVKNIAKAIVYTSNLIGAQHVALGSDFDGAINTIIEVRGLPLIVEELLKLGMSQDEIRLVMGENVKRVLLENLPD